MGDVKASEVAAAVGAVGTLGLGVHVIHEIRKGLDDFVKKECQGLERDEFEGRRDNLVEFLRYAEPLAYLPRQFSPETLTEFRKLCRQLGGIPRTESSGASRPAAASHRSIEINEKRLNWVAAAKTAIYGLLTIGSAAVTVVAGLATIGTTLDPIPGDEVALGAGTTAMAGITATSATIFYLSGKEFLKSVFD